MSVVGVILMGVCSSIYVHWTIIQMIRFVSNVKPNHDLIIHLQNASLRTPVPTPHHSPALPPQHAPSPFHNRPPRVCYHFKLFLFLTAKHAPSLLQTSERKTTFYFPYHKDLKLKCNSLVTIFFWSSVFPIWRSHVDCEKVPPEF